MAAEDWLLRVPGPEIDRLPGSLELAFLGDTIYDMYVRRMLVEHGGPMKRLQQEASHRVCAHAQSEALACIEPLLNDEEAAVVRRARNAKQHPPRNSDPAEYQRATGLEALLGWLYIRGKAERIDALLTEIFTRKEEANE